MSSTCLRLKILRIHLFLFYFCVHNDFSCNIVIVCFHIVHYAIRCKSRFYSAHNCVFVVDATRIKQIVYSVGAEPVDWRQYRVIVDWVTRVQCTHFIKRIISAGFSLFVFLRKSMTIITALFNRIRRRRLSAPRKRAPHHCPTKIR